MENKFHEMLMIILMSFTASLSINLNKYAIKKEKHEMYSIFILLTEIFVHAVSGIIVALLITNFTTSIYILSAFAGMGGMIGQRVIYGIVESLLKKYELTNNKENTSSNITNIK